MYIRLALLAATLVGASSSARAETLRFYVDSDVSTNIVTWYQWLPDLAPASSKWRMTGSLDLVVDEVAGTASITNIDLFGIGINGTQDRPFYINPDLLRDGRFVTDDLIAFGDRPPEFFAPWENPSPPFGEGETITIELPRPGRTTYYEALLTDNGLRLFGGRDTTFADGGMGRLDLTLIPVPEPSCLVLFALCVGAIGVCGCKRHSNRH